MTDAAPQLQSPIRPSELAAASIQHRFAMAVPPAPAPVGFTAIGPAGRGPVTFQAPAVSQPAAAPPPAARAHRDVPVRPVGSCECCAGKFLPRQCDTQLPWLHLPKYILHSDQDELYTTNGATTRHGMCRLGAGRLPREFLPRQPQGPSQATTIPSYTSQRYDIHHGAWCMEASVHRGSHVHTWRTCVHHISSYDGRWYHLSATIAALVACSTPTAISTLSATLEGGARLSAGLPGGARGGVDR